MIEISCFYIHYIREPVNFTFIKYEKFMKICLQTRIIILEIENLKKYPILFQFYILSLLCTENTSNIDYYFYENCVIYGVSTKQQWKKSRFCIDYDVISLEKYYMKNPLLSQEPKKQTSNKKIKKLLKIIYNYYDNNHINDPLYTIYIYENLLIDDTKIKKIIEYETLIYNLCCIKRFNNDIYMNIKKFV